ncbi:hypothetical protein BDV96DRAFT_601217 [Lophiotrema nucula]|uniref:Uncharacterized protein n=1 Tax=Lophiotrema nucula TaxID=690887 RepID=A0A6A5Z2V2_9PLEO|nr:hypothetical protein BDV96DRAFT_601217 [Lophiotrema nucula]
MTSTHHFLSISGEIRNAIYDAVAVDFTSSLSDYKGFYLSCKQVNGEMTKVCIAPFSKLIKLSGDGSKYLDQRVKLTVDQALFKRHVIIDPTMKLIQPSPCGALRSIKYALKISCMPQTDQVTMRLGYGVTVCHYIAPDLVEKITRLLVPELQEPGRNMNCFKLFMLRDGVAICNGLATIMNKETWCWWSGIEINRRELKNSSSVWSDG